MRRCLWVNRGPRRASTPEIKRPPGSGRGGMAVPGSRGDRSRAVSPSTAARSPHPGLTLRFSARGVTALHYT